ncbi:MAG: hypothetical protein ABR964_15900 [Tepidisphaeraceae bacterium]|jgi:hypothetical protein
MKRPLFWLVPLVAAVGFCALLRADDLATPPVPPATRNLSDVYTCVKLVERYAQIAKDADASGVAAVLEANELLKGKDPNVAIGYFQKMLYDTKSRAVQRAIRVQLAEQYKILGQTDHAMEQLQALMTESQ